MREKIISLTAKNFVWDYCRGSGSGGQKRNKTSSAVRCRHILSGAQGWCESSRSQLQNKQEAFLKLTATKEFKAWLKIEIAKKNGEFAKIDEDVDILMAPENLKIEYCKNYS